MASPGALDVLPDHVDLARLDEQIARSPAGLAAAGPDGRTVKADGRRLLRRSSAAELPSG